VVEHFLLEIEDLHLAVGLDPLGKVERVIPGAGADLQHPLAGLRGEGLLQAPAGDHRVRQLDPEPLAVRARRRVFSQPVGDHDQRERDAADELADHVPEKPIV
jgi:hypothetical protein